MVHVRDPELLGAPQEEAAVNILRRSRLASGLAVAGTVAVLSAGTVQAATVSVSIVNDSAFSPFKAKAQQGDTVTWTNNSLRQHNVTSDSGLFRSPRLAEDATPGAHMQPGTSYSFGFTSSGKYTYRCSLDNFAGVIVVPLKASPASGTTATPFTITWATNVPAGWVEDVQIKRPGGTVFKDWRMGQTGTSSSFTPDKGAGTYSFQARLRNTTTGATSGYAGPKSISVS